MAGLLDALAGSPQPGGLLGGQEMRSYSPTLRERMAAYLMGDNPSQPRRDFVGGLLGSTGLGSTGMGLADLTPLGVPMAMQESYRAGDPQGMALAVAPFGVGVRGATKGIRAYHGSPHDFERFDMSKIGTGEGAQAYGHGLYFAENPKVAQEYKGITLSPRARMIFDDAGGDIEKAKALAVERGFGRGFVMDDLEMLAKNSGPGRMYEVNINAKPEQFLDWDKPVAPKTPLREMLAEIGMKGTGSSYADVRNAAKDTFLAAQNPNLTGEGAYRSLARAAVRPEDIRPGFDARSPIAATSALREAGIPGIKYLDQGSRQIEAPQHIAARMEENATRKDYISRLPEDRRTKAIYDEFAKLDEESKSLRSELDNYRKSQQTSNYVLFRDDIIDILRKYGLAGTLGAGAAAQTAAPDQGQQ